MRFPIFPQVLLPAVNRPGMAWFEWPLLAYFMLHFFPPIPGPVGTVCLVLSAFGVFLEGRSCGYPRIASLNHRIIWAWLLFLGLFGLSLFQVPSELLGESRHRFTSDLVKGTFFALIVFFYLDRVERASRLLVAGALACFLMFFHFLAGTIYIVVSAGKFPFQRDYLFWMVTFFPFALALYVAQPRRPWFVLIAGFGAAGAMALAVLTGFRGATLAILVMLFIFVVQARMWRLLTIGLVLVLLGFAILYAWFPEQAAYVLAKFQQTNASNRWGGHWLPAWDMSTQAPWLGHGFGHNVFRHHYGIGIPGHPAWQLAFSEQLGWLPSSPHSIFFETLFTAGWPGLLALLLLSLILIQCLVSSIWRQRNELETNHWVLLGLATVTSFIGNYVVFYQFEAPAWRTLPIIVAIAAACSIALRLDICSVLDRTKFKTTEP